MTPGVRTARAGTTARFVLLIVMLLVASATMTQNVSASIFGTDGPAGLACLLAAGIDPDQAESAASVARWEANQEALRACGDRYAPPPPWWAGPAWTMFLLVGMGLLFNILPAWKGRRGRVVPLATADQDGAIRRSIEELAAVAGLRHAPNAVVDPADESTDPVMFGSNRRATIRLPGGLLATRLKDRERFRAVLLHEFAHVRNGDITLTYLTVAGWRVFLAVVLLPYIAWYVYAFPGGPWQPDWAAAVPLATRNLLLPLVMVLLVYLARLDVLRTREIHADLAAVRWGAHPDRWTTAAAPSGAVRQTFDAFVGLWGTHPRGIQRREALTDPARVFRIGALSMFLTGVAGALVHSQLVEIPGQSGGWTERVTTWAAAGLITGAAGIALWQVVADAVSTGRPASFGLVPGLWLGAGMAAVELVTHHLTVTRWLPDHPAALLLPVSAGAVFGCWITCCARLWLGGWRWHRTWPVMLLVLTAAGSVLAAWLGWWRDWAGTLADGLPSAGHLVIAAQSLLTLPTLAVIGLVPLLGFAIRPLARPRWRIPLATFCVAAAALSIAVSATAVRPDPSGSSRRESTSAQISTVSVRTRALQLAAWYGLGGWELGRRFYDEFDRLTEALSADLDANPSMFEPVCASIGQVTREAERYFPVPESTAQEHWRTFIARAGHGSDVCLRAATSGDRGEFADSLRSFDDAERALNLLGLRIRMLTSLGGLPGW